jgi:hypothetical protein
VFVVRVPAILPRVVVAAVLMTAAGLPAGALAAPVSSTGAVEVSAAVRHDVSPPLRNLRPSAPSAASLREQPLRLIGGSGANGPDGALQISAGPAAATTPGLSFAGIGQGDYGFTDAYAPPDTNGAVGATQYVQWVNVNFAVFDKSTHALVFGPVAGNTIWSGFGGGCQANNNGDPIVQYDKAANRWIMTQFSISTSPYLQCVAVSTTSDATGSYYRYAFGFGTQFPDYPKLGVWPDGYYMSFNIFNGGTTWAGAKACALDRNAMLAGAAATIQCFQQSTAVASLLPSDLDGTNPPPAGSPDFFLNYGSNSLNLWKFHVDFANSANSTFTGPTVIPVASFSAACNGGGTCIPQPGTTQKLDSLADRLMYRLAYRNFGDHEALVVNQSVTAGSSTGIRWYEIRSPNVTPTVFQQGTYAPDAAFRWMGSIAMDHVGDIAVGYSVSSSSINPSIRYTGRVPTEPLGSLESETPVIAGSGSQLPTLSRWGDYSAMTVDPVDDCTFWYTNEYLKTSGDFNWSTSFKFPGCSTSATQAPAITSANATTFTIGTLGSFTVTATGLPTPAISESGALPVGVTFTDNGNGTGTLQGTPGVGTAGTYSLTFTAHNGVGSDAVQTFTLTVNPAAAPDFSLSASPASQTVTQGSGTSYKVTVNPSGGFAGLVNLSLTGLPSGATGTFVPTSVTGSGTSTLTVTTSATSTPAGTYTLTITGTSGSLSHATNVTLVVTAPDFSLSASPASQTVTQGSGTSYKVTVNPSGGFAGLVNLSLSGLPRATAGSFSLNPTATSSTLTVTTSQSAKKRTYQLTVTGVSGTLTHTVGVTLTIR